jgi:GT2 family glycosyltransferase
LSPAAPPRVSAIVVTYRQVELTLEAIASLEAQTVPVDEILVVDNDPSHSAREPIAAAHPDVRLLNADNVGYAPACNRGAAAATGDWLFFLNPDAAAAPDCLERLLATAAEHPGAGVVTPQVLMPDGETVNAGENRIHLTGITWCGRLGEHKEDGPARPVFVTTGASMLVRADLYRRLDGYCDEFFLYYEDPDFCWRTWIAGGEVWFVPRAHVRHHYAWGDGTGKWFHLERNRLLSVLTNYEASTLGVLAPLLAGTEAALLAVSAREGWLREKRRAYAAVWRRRAWMVERRRALAQLRRRRDAELIDRFQATVDTPQIASPVARRAAPLLRAYRALAVALVRRLSPPS